MRRRLICTLLALAVVLLPGCGIRPEPDPTAIDIAPVIAPSPATPELGPLNVTVYHIRNDRLTPVERAVSETSAATLLSVLTAGPTRQEVVTGLRTALTPQPLTLTTDPGTPDIADVAVSADFADITGKNQLLAVAQVVWTVTEIPGLDRVRLSADGEPLEIPTDHGLVRGPVGREHYMSVAPNQPPETTLPSPVPTGSASGPG